MNEEFKGTRNITPAMALKILKKSGKDVSEQQAEKILDLMYFLAGLIVEQNFTNKQNIDNK